MKSGEAVAYFLTEIKGSIQRKTKLDGESLGIVKSKLTLKSFLILQKILMIADGKVLVDTVSQ